VYGPGLDERLERLQELQTHLGKLNDCDATLALLSEMLPTGSKQRVKIERELSERAARHKAEFLAYWRDTFDQPDQEQWWVGYLDRNSRNGKKR
jgi:CHAD domain-containing protein